MLCVTNFCGLPGGGFCDFVGFAPKDAQTTFFENCPTNARTLSNGGMSTVGVRGCVRETNKFFPNMAFPHFGRSR